MQVDREEEEWLICSKLSGDKGWIPKSFCQNEEEYKSPDPLCNAKVLFDFEGRTKDELSCIKGQILFVLAKSDPDWWYCMFEQRQGMVPQNHLEELVLEFKKPEQGLNGQNDPFENLPSVDSETSQTQPFEIVSASPETGTPEEKSRSDVIIELIQTEIAYVQDLQTIIEHFYNPLMKSNSAIRLDVIFSNIGDIFSFNKKLLAHFQNAHASQQPIGSVFLNCLDELDCYKPYCENMERSSQYLQQIRNQNPRLDEFLKTKQTTVQERHEVIEESREFI